MATITTTATNNPLHPHCHCEGAQRLWQSRFIAKERSDRGNPGLQTGKKPVGAEPTRRTIAHGVGSYEKPDSTTGAQKTVIPAKAGIQLRSSLGLPSKHAANLEPTKHTLRSLRTSALSAYKDHQKISAPSASQKLSLRRSAATVAIPGSAMPRRSRAPSANNRPQCGLLQAIRLYYQPVIAKEHSDCGNPGQHNAP